jgi:hypothetical protein
MLASHPPIPAQALSRQLADVERSFARHAFEHSIRQAFLAYMDTGSLLAAPDNELVPGIPLHQARPENDAWLLWKPAYAEMAASGDFGFTTGPYDFRAAKSPDSAVLSRGAFATVWRKTSAGWKFVIDLGVSYPMGNEQSADGEYFPTEKRSRPSAGRPDFLRAETGFVRLFAGDPAKAYKKYRSKRGRLLRPGRYPLQPSDPWPPLPALRFEPLGQAAASSGDLAVVYGYCYDGPKRDAFMRVWRREGSKGWKIALEVLRF